MSPIVPVVSCLASGLLSVIASTQVYVHVGEMSPEPSLLQADPSQLSQPLLLCCNTQKRVCEMHKCVLTTTILRSECHRIKIVTWERTVLNKSSCENLLL